MTLINIFKVNKYAYLVNYIYILNLTLKERKVANGF